jgi:hypothetical protein
MQNDVRVLRQGQPGPYASARMSSREEATRAEMPAPSSHRTQPLAVTMGSHVPGTSNTVPMPVASQGIVTAAPGFGALGSGPPQGPGSVRTAPLAMQAQAPGPGSFATTMPSTQPGPAPAFATSQPVATTGRLSSRGSLALIAVLGFAGLLLAGGAAAWYLLSGRSDEGGATALPSPLPPADSASPTNVGSPPGSPAPTSDDGTDPTTPRRVPAKKDGPSAPSASASPTPATPTAAPSPSGATPAPAAPSASGAVAPPAPPPTPTPTTPPSPTSPASTTAAPTSPAAPPTPGDSSRKRGKGRGRGG